MENLIITPDQQRGTYERIIRLVGEALGITPQEVKEKYRVQPYTLKMGAYLSPSLSTYSMSPRKGVDNPQIPNSILLDQNDLFAMDSISIRIGRAAFASNAYSNHGNYPLFTSVDPVYFAGTGTAAGSEWQGLQTLVNGTLSVQVSNDSIIDALLVQDLMYSGTKNYNATGPVLPEFGGSDSRKGYDSFTPQILMDASVDNSFVVTCANGARGNIDGAISTGTTDSGTRNLIYILAQGWKIKNASGLGVTCGRV